MVDVLVELKLKECCLEEMDEEKLIEIVRKFSLPMGSILKLFCYTIC